MHRASRTSGASTPSTPTSAHISTPPWHSEPTFHQLEDWAAQIQIYSRPNQNINRVNLVRSVLRPSVRPYCPLYNKSNIGEWGALQSSPEGCVPAAQGFSCCFDTRKTQTFCLYYSLDHTLLNVKRWQALLVFHSEEISIVRLSVCVWVCFCLCVIIVFTDCRIHLFSSLAARLFNKLTRYYTHTLNRRQLKSAHYAETTDFSLNNLYHCCCCKPTSHCNKLHEPVDLLDRLRLRHELRQALWHLSN